MKLKAEMLALSKRRAAKLFDDSYANLDRQRWTKRLWKIVVDLDYVMLNEHITEIEGVIELIQAMFVLEVKVDNLDEVFDRWWLLYNLTSELQCKAAYSTLLEFLWSDENLRSILALTKLVIPCQSPYPSEVVRLFKAQAAKRFRENYTKINNSLKRTIGSIQRIQNAKHQAVAYSISGFIALCIGISNFFSRWMW